MHQRQSLKASSRAAPLSPRIVRDQRVSEKVAHSRRDRNQRREQPRPLSPWERYAEFVRIPRVKLILRNTFYLAYLFTFVTLFFSLIELNTGCGPNGHVAYDAVHAPKLNVLLHLFSAWTFAIFLDEMHQLLSGTFADCECMSMRRARDEANLVPSSPMPPPSHHPYGLIGALVPRIRSGSTSFG